mgnify:CR=1 FL=1
MRVVKCEKIYLSQDEKVIWQKFDQLLDAIEKESSNPYVHELVDKIQSDMFSLDCTLEEG